MNIKDIASLAETSVATVSRVLNNEEYVSAETRKRVLEVINATGYKPNLVGRALRSQRSGKILVLIPTIRNPFYSQVLEGVEHRASANGYDTMVCITHRNPDCEYRELDFVQTKQADGAIGFTSALSDKKLSQFAAAFPYVQCGSQLASRNICYVCIDNVAATEEAVEHFIRAGHTRIAFVNGAFGRPYEQERERGYKLALQKYNIPIRQDYLRTCEYDYTGGYKSSEELLALPEPPTAILASSDQIAAGIVKCLLKTGKIPGKDIDVIGFDGTYLSDMCTPAISALEQPGYDMGKAAFDLLLDRITNPDSVIKRIVLAHKLVLKETTRPQIK